MTFTPELPTPQTNRSYLNRLVRFLLIVSFLGGLSLWGSWYYFITAVHHVPIASYSSPLEFTIPAGSGARAIAEILYERQLIASDTLFYLMTLTYFDPSSLKAGTYRLLEPVSMFDLASQITRGDVVHDLITLTHIEGERATQIATKAAVQLPKFDPVEFLDLASTSEGMLYPDTYYIDDDFTAQDLYTLLINTYKAKTAPLREQIQAHKLTETEILTLASIIEREANTDESMRMVSGILQNRLQIGMALQADASIEYVLDKDLSELTPEDLKRDTPYNTYLYPGLPPTPIGNPGLAAISAVLNPTPSSYFYYITGDDGEFYFAKTFDEHRRNIARHLR